VPVNVVATLRKAVRGLEAEQARVEHQLTAIRIVLGTLDGAKGPAVRAERPVRPRRRRRMSAAARRATSRRMKAYWAKRKAAAREKGTPRKR
jgi:hypothetical protein